MRSISSSALAFTKIDLIVFDLGRRHVGAVDGLADVRAATQDKINQSSRINEPR